MVWSTISICAMTYSIKTQDKELVKYCQIYLNLTYIPRSFQCLLKRGLVNFQQRVVLAWGVRLWALPHLLNIKKVNLDYGFKIVYYLPPLMWVANSPNSSTKWCFQCPLIHHGDLKHENYKWNLRWLPRVFAVQNTAFQKL